MNHLIAGVNADLVPSGLSMPAIMNGPSCGGVLGASVGERLAVEIGYDRLWADTDVGDSTGSLLYSVPANLLRVMGRCKVVRSSRLDGFLDASLGLVSTVGNITAAAYGYGTNSVSVHGSGLAFELGAGGELRLVRQLALDFGCGYRHARVNRIQRADQVLFNSAGSHYSVDYSGGYLRGGVTLELAP